MKIRKQIFRNIMVVLSVFVVVGVAVLFALNAHVKSVGKAHILTVENASSVKDVDCIIVLGCRVRNDGSLSDMLRDRLLCGLELYDAGVAPKLLMSGDHGRMNYDEVGTMKNYAIENGVPSENVFMDHAGFSTYETIYRAKEIFRAEKVMIVTQEYHLYRALYIAQQLGVEAYGVSADLHTYAGQSMRDFREVLARLKDFVMCIVKPKPTYLGDVIPVSGNGDLTNDK